MHSPLIRRLIDNTRNKLEEAKAILLQSPDHIGTLTSTDLAIVIGMADAALSADPLNLRADVATAYRRIRRCRFPREESIRLFSVFADIAYALEDIERAAASAHYPLPGERDSLPSYFVVERGKLLKQLDALERYLLELDVKLVDLDASKAGTPDLAQQDALINSVNRRASAKSKMVRDISAEHAVDIRSLSHSIEGLDRTIEAFAETIFAPTARVTSVTRQNTRSLKKVSGRVVAAGANTQRTAIKELKRSVEADPPFVHVARESSPLFPATSKESNYTHIRDQHHLLDVLHQKGNLRGCDLSTLRIQGIDLSNKDLSGSNWMGSALDDVNMSHANLKGANFERALLISVNMTKANLWGVNFWMARLRNTNVTSAIIEHTNFWNTEGIPKAFLSDTSRPGIISFGDYGSFFDYFAGDLGMSKKEIGDTFSWVRSEHFSEMLWNYYD